MQERGYDLGFHEIWGHSPLHAPPQTEEFLKSAGFHVKSKDHLQGIVTLCFYMLLVRYWSLFLSYCLKYLLNIHFNGILHSKSCNYHPQHTLFISNNLIFIFSLDRQLNLSIGKRLYFFKCHKLLCSPVVDPGFPVRGAWTS